MKELEKTDYVIKQEDGGYSSYKSGVLVSKGCLDEEWVLHSIWTSEGRKPDDFYTADSDGVVTCVHRDVL